MNFRYYLILKLLTYLLTTALADQGNNEFSAKIRYDNYQVYKINIKDTKQLQLMNAFQNQTKFSVWKDYNYITNDIHVMVKAQEVYNFLQLMHDYDIEKELLIENVQELIDLEQSHSGSSKFDWTRYYQLHEIEQWLDDILLTYPNVTESFSIGNSYENRPIRGIKIAFKPNNPVIFIEANIHAREWITSATATWFINELLTSEDLEVREMAENYNWYIIPVLNVDGFVFSHERDRLWRKTRQPTSTPDCIGTDPNRNFDSHWMENGGASGNPCEETYAGPEPFSESETKALAEFLTSIQHEIKIYLAFHSYSQLLLSPYGHTIDPPENYEDLLQIGKAFADAIGSLPYNTTYRYGSTATTIYITSGASVDWVYNNFDTVNVAYTIEFRDQGRFGFVLPPVQIIPNCEELMAGILALVSKSHELEYI
uniref:Zinc carboxypeptidase A 1 n=1 Tax=Glossina brevipalpis TaxID=37001 RepID=A0A1A9W1S5_9MUSC